MPVSGVGYSGANRNEQVRSERRAEETRNEEDKAKRVESEQRSKDTRQASESGRGDNVDFTT